jgi:hypothetical protein
MNDKLDGYTHRPQRFVDLPLFCQKSSMGVTTTNWSRQVDTRLDLNRLILAEMFEDSVVRLTLDTSGGVMIRYAKMTPGQLDGLLLNGDWRNIR